MGRRSDEDRTMGDSDAPDFSMLRAVEILASIFERAQREQTLAPPSDKPIVLFSETIALQVGISTRSQVEAALGIAFSYPARGWHTYCVKGTRGERLFASLFYGEETLAAAELYVPKVDRAPNLARRDVPFRFVPGEITVGMTATALPEHYARMPQLTTTTGPYAEMFEARFPGGAAYAMGNAGVIERLALYVLETKEKPA